MYKFHHRFYRDVQPFRDTVPFPEKLQCIMMLFQLWKMEKPAIDTTVTPLFHKKTLQRTLSLQL